VININGVNRTTAAKFTVKKRHSWC
jgi:hypothetical protein